MTKKYKKIVRIGSKEEQEDVAMLMALNMYTESQDFPKDHMFNDDAHKLGMNKYIELNKERFMEEMEGALMVEEYKDHGVKIYSCSLTSEEEGKEGVLMNFPFRFFKNENEFLQLNYDVYFDLNERIRFKKNTVGRPKKPTKESILKTTKVNYDLTHSNDPGLTIDGLCKKYKISKSTYYRVAKYLSDKPKFK